MFPYGDHSDCQGLQFRWLLRDFRHVSIRPGSTILRVAQTHIASASDMPPHAGAKRVWVQTSCPTDPERLVSNLSRACIEMWLDLLQHDFQVFTLLRPAPIQCSAYADACADTQTAGLGGFVRLPSGACAFFRCTLDRRALQSLASWYDPALPPQSFISAWELLAQLGLLWLLHTMLPIGHPPVLMDMHCDNSAAESASWKGVVTKL